MTFLTSSIQCLLMKNKFDKSSLLPHFKAETQEHLRILNRGLLALEKNVKDMPLMESLMRTAHTLKGSAVIAGFKRIVELAHKFEDALIEIKEGRLEARGEHFELLFGVLDSIGPLLEDKVFWPEKGVAHPHVMNLEKKINTAFELEGEKTVSETSGKGPVPPEFILEDSAETIRVDVDKLDNLVNLAGELVISKISFGQRIQKLSELVSELEEFNKRLINFEQNLGEGIIKKGEDIRDKLEQLEKDFSSVDARFGAMSSDLQEGIMKTRMLPVATLFNIFPRSVRDLSKREGKSVELVIGGDQTELDRGVLQRIEDPLMHIIRNAITHGIETPDLRERLGKSKEGKITLSAYQRGGLVVIEVADDGKGINVEEVKAKAVEQKLITPTEAEQLSPEQTLQFLFNPGFTTKNETTQASGRGVGLDVVRTSVARLKGQLEVASAPDKGTRFTIKLPFTLAISLALMVKSSGQVFAIPFSSLEEIIRITEEEIGSIETKQVIQVRDKIIPLARLGELLKLRKRDLIERKYQWVVIVRAVERQMALIVDDFLGKQEIVVKNLGDHLAPVDNIDGSTILGTGEVALILDIAALIETAARIAGRPTSREQVSTDKKTASILIVDDSATTLQSEKLILESVGYKVIASKNGREGLQMLAEVKPDLVITDLTMPVMGGFEMLEEMKKDTLLKDIPAIIVTAKTDEADRKKGLELGAAAYIIKSEFDESILLETVAKLTCAR